MEISSYSANATLRDGRQFEIRALTAEDRTGLVEAVGRMSEQSLYFRFFGTKRFFTDSEIRYFTDVDFVSHVALVAVLEENGRQLLVGGGRYIVTQPGCAEIAFGVDDAHQGMGIASTLLRHLAAIAHEAGLVELYAEVMPGNTAMLKVFGKFGPAVTILRQPDAVHVTLHC